MCWYDYQRRISGWLWTNEWLSQDLDPILESPTRLFTNDQTNFIYILEPKQKRIVVLDKTGNMAAQYYSDTFNNLQDFSLDETNKKIFLANDNKIYSFNLSHLQ